MYMYTAVCGAASRCCAGGAAPRAANRRRRRRSDKVALSSALTSKLRAGTHLLMRLRRRLEASEALADARREGAAAEASRYVRRGFGPYARVAWVEEGGGG